MALLNKIEILPLSGVYPDKGGREGLGVRSKGSTLIESIVATIVIMFCFTAVTTIYVNVFRADDHTRRFNGRLILKNAALKVKAEKTFLDQTFKVDELTVEKTVSKYGQAENPDQQLWLLKLKLFDPDKKLLSEYKELIIN